jgi:hypothetical protein
VTGKNMANLVLAIKNVIEEHSSFENCFLKSWIQADEAVLLRLFSYPSRSLSGKMWDTW